MGKKRFSSVFLLTDSNTAAHCLPVFKKQHPEVSDAFPLSIPPGEIHKNLDTCMGLWKQLSEHGADRKSLLINLGGGVVTDLGGFVASTYQRGISFVNTPTTLLSMVDASVGGKTGVDLGTLKNQIGVIRNPDLVLIRPEFLETLDKRQVRSGFAEMLKHGLIMDREYWNHLKALENLDGLDRWIYKSVLIKNEVVTTDPNENGRRKILNFGHTLGHALESYFLDNSPRKPLLHGEAIAIGMILEAFLSVETCGMTRAECDEIKEVFLRFFPKTILKQEDREPILRLLRYDKKNASGKVLFSLLHGIGNACINQEVTAEQLKAAFDYYMD
ncbi:MAG: 3-dehydroquinate synthase [Robiginitalea sp.]